MYRVSCAAGSGKVQIVIVVYQLTCTGTHDERQRRLLQLRELERAAKTADERQSWRHAVRQVERAIARAIAPSARAGCASPAPKIIRGRARRAPRAPHRAAAARAAPPGDPDPDPDYKSTVSTREAGRA